MRIENPNYRIVMENEQTGNAVAISVVSFVGAVKFIRRTARRLGMELVSFRRPDGSEYDEPYKRVPGDVATIIANPDFVTATGANTFAEWLGTL